MHIEKRPNRNDGSRYIPKKCSNLSDLSFPPASSSNGYRNPIGLDPVDWNAIIKEEAVVTNFARSPTSMLTHQLRQCEVRQRNKIAQVQKRRKESRVHESSPVQKTKARKRLMIKCASTDCESISVRIDVGCTAQTLALLVLQEYKFLLTRSLSIDMCKNAATGRHKDFVNQLRPESIRWALRVGASDGTVDMSMPKLNQATEIFDCARDSFVLRWKPNGIWDQTFEFPIQLLRQVSSSPKSLVAVAVCFPWKKLKQASLGCCSGCKTDPSPSTNVQGASKIDQPLRLDHLEARVLLPRKPSGTKGSGGIPSAQPLLSKTINKLSFSSTMEPQKPIYGHTRPAWVADSASKHCMVPCCNQRFQSGLLGFFSSRRHHCRACGSLVCGPHSQTYMVLPHLGYMTPVRVCDSCASKLSSACLTYEPASASNDTK